MQDPGHFSSFIDPSLSSYYFDRMKKEIPFRELKLNTGRNLPRLVFRYEPDESGTLDVLQELISIVESRLFTTVKGVFCNLYRNGSDWTPLHQDSYNLDVFTISFGATRSFKIKSMNDDISDTTYKLENGDAFFFSGETNKKMKHTVPKTKKDVGERISVVFFI